MIKFLIQLLCLFVPVRAWRKAIRQKFFAPVSRPKIMRRFYKIAGWRIEKVDGVKVAGGVLRNGATLRLGHVFDKDITPAHVAHSVFCNGEYHFSARGEAVVIDIGMNVGFASLYFAMREDVVEVYGYEPVPETYKKAVFNFRLNDSHSKIIVPRNCGLGCHSQNRAMTFGGSHSGAASMVAGHIKSGEEITVQVLDAAEEINNIVRMHEGRRIVVKCDAEGAEKEIFERLDETGALTSIDTIIMEYHFGYDRLIAPLLQKHGFVYFKSGNRLGIIRAVKQNGGK